MKTYFAIHKSLPYTALDIHKSIEEGTELKGCITSTYSDGWVIADIEDTPPWSRNKDDYKVEWIEWEIDGEIEKDTNSIKKACL